MGNAVQVNSNVVNTNYPATLRDSLTVSGNITGTGDLISQDTDAGSAEGLRIKTV